MQEKISLFSSLPLSRQVGIVSPLRLRSGAGGRGIFFLPSPLPDIASDVTPLHKWRGGRGRGIFFSPLSARGEGLGERNFFLPSPLAERDWGRGNKKSQYDLSHHFRRITLAIWKKPCTFVTLTQLNLLPTECHPSSTFLRKLFSSNNNDRRILRIHHCIFFDC